MRKKIALFTNGWSSEFLQEIGQGIVSAASIADLDIFTFVNYTMFNDDPENRTAEANIFKLPDVSTFDGAIIMANTFNIQEEIEYVHNAVLAAGIPAISLEYHLDGIDYFGTDDASGMRALTKHLIKHHKIKNAVFIGGMKEHTGSNIRLNAVKATLAEYNLELQDNNIIYGQFSAAPAVAAFEKWYANNGKLPDAIICANDIMAIGICNWLKDHQYRIPDDVIVTGFDCLNIGQEYDPPLTTVNREWYTMGIKCIEKLLAKMSGKQIMANEELATNMVCGASCGCKNDNFSVSRLLRKSDYRFQLDGFTCDQHFRHMYIAMRKSGTAAELTQSLSDFFIKEGWLEGNNIMVAFNPRYFSSEDWSVLNTDGYPENMEVICNVSYRCCLETGITKTSDLIFAAASRSDSCGCYFFVPIRVDEYSLGFAMLSSDFTIFQKDVLYLWCRHMSQYTEQVKSNALINQLNKRLSALSVTDALTGIYNRTGCETMMYTGVEQNQANQGQSVIMIADLDRLKYINDTYGHNQGDTAIKLAVSALLKALPSGYMIGRYGGDEFLITGYPDAPVDLDALIDSIGAEAELESERNSTPYTLSISIGAIQLDKGVTADIMECIRIADAKMYKMKQEHHKKQES